MIDEPKIKTPKSTRPHRPGPRPVKERVDAALAKVSPEEQDALELQAMLPEELSVALMGTDKPLMREGKPEEFASPLLSMQARHSLIVRLRAQGTHPARIARAVGVTETTVHNVVKNWYAKHADKLRQADMDQFVLMLADGYLEDIDKLTEVVNQSGKFPAAVVGAIKARQEARQKYVDILVEFGFLKRQPTQIEVDHKNAPTQQILVLSPTDLKAASEQFLRAKRKLLGQPEDDASNERISSLIVGASSPSHPEPTTE